MLKLRLIYVFVVSEVVLQSSFTFMFTNPTIVKKKKKKKYRHTELLAEELWTRIPQVWDGSL